jgi:hypothetical protein
MKKFTLATAKSFIKKNRSNLLIKVISRFDGRYDCVMSSGDKMFQPITNADYTYDHEHNLGINGVWFTHSGNSFYPRYNARGEVIGFECCNCCGSFVVKVLEL